MGEGAVCGCCRSGLPALLRAAAWRCLPHGVVTRVLLPIDAAAEPAVCDVVPPSRRALRVCAPAPRRAALSSIRAWWRRHGAPSRQVGGRLQRDASLALVGAAPLRRCRHFTSSRCTLCVSLILILSCWCAPCIVQVARWRPRRKQHCTAARLLRTWQTTWPAPETRRLQLHSADIAGKRLRAVCAGLRYRCERCTVCSAGTGLILFNIR